MERKTIQVVGGGFSGLSVAYFLVREGFSVRLVEDGAYLGGMLQTIHTPCGPVETAANALLSNALVESTATELGLELVAALPSARRRFVYRKGRPRRWPLSGAGTTRFLTETMPRFVLRRRSFAPRAGESVRDWGYRLLGREATEYLLIPGLSGVYAGRAEDLSATLILGRFFLGGLKTRRGRLRGSVAPREGMGAWGVAFGKWLEARGTEFAREAVPGLRTVVALPAGRALAFLAERAPTLAKELEWVESLPLLSATCFFPDTFPGIEGFGCLFPRSEGFRVLGILANDRIFPGRAAPGLKSETWIFGGATDPGVLELSDLELQDTIEREREKIHGLATPLTHVQISRWPRGIPHYTVSLENLRTTVEGEYTLFGTYLGDLGLARVLIRAQELARSFS